MNKLGVWECYSIPKLLLQVLLLPPILRAFNGCNLKINAQDIKEISVLYGHLLAKSNTFSEYCGLLDLL